MKETWLAVFSDSGWKDEDDGWHRASPFTGTEHHVALTLATYMSPNGDSCFPSIPRLAAGSGRADSTIREALDRLVEWGFLERQRHRGRGNSNEYVARIPEYFDWDGSAEENRLRAEVFASGNEQLLVGPAAKPVPDAVSGPSEKTAGGRRFSEEAGAGENRRSGSAKPPEGLAKTSGERRQLVQDQTTDHPSSRPTSLQTPSSYAGERPEKPAAASESEPVAIEQAVASLARLEGWDSGSLSVVMPLLQQIPGKLFEETLAKTLAREARNRVGLLVRLLQVAIGDWRQAQNDARLETWDAFFGEAGLERVKREDPDRYVLAWATPALDEARPLPWGLVAEHIADYVLEHTDDAAERERLLTLFIDSTDRAPAFRSLRDWSLKAIDRHGRAHDDVAAVITNLTAGHPETRDELLAFAREVHENVQADKRRRAA